MPFVAPVNSLCSFVIVRVKPRPQKGLPGRGVSCILSLGALCSEWSLVDIWLEETVREGVALRFVWVNTRGKAQRERKSDREEKEKDRERWHWFSTQCWKQWVNITVVSGCVDSSSQPALLFTSDDRESHRVFSCALSSPFPASPARSPAAFPLSLTPFRHSSLPLPSRLCCGWELASGQTVTWMELQRSEWGRRWPRAAGASWAALAVFCFSPPRRLELAHFSAAPGFSSHLVNLQLLKQKARGRGGVRKKKKVGGERKWDRCGSVIETAGGVRWGQSRLSHADVLRFGEPQRFLCPGHLWGLH